MTGATEVAFRAGPLIAARRRTWRSTWRLRNAGEDEAAHLYRHELFWRAWLAAVAARGSADAVPGEVGSGLGGMVRDLAKGARPLRRTARRGGGVADRGPSPTTGSTPRQLAPLLAEIVPFPSAASRVTG